MSVMYWRITVIKSLYAKFVATTIGIMLLSGLIAFLLSNFYYQQILKPYNDEKNTAVALEIAAYASEQSDLEAYLENIASLGYQLYMTDAKNNEIYFGAPYRKQILPEQTKQRVLKGEVYHGIEEFPQETFVTGFFANELTNTIGVPIKYENETYALFMRPDIKMLFNELHLLFAWMLLITIVLSIVFVFISTKLLVNPISKLKEATNELSTGNFAVELDINRADEIGELAQDFTYMAKQLEKLDVMKNEFIENVSHDIQTPLSNIKGYSNLLGESTLTKDEKNRYVSIINNEINRLSNLTKQLLLLASLDQQENLMHKTKFSLVEQLKKVMHYYQWEINEKNIMLSYSLSNVYITGDQALLHSVWENLLTNAIKYNVENGSIDLSVTDKEKYIEISFKDSGIGMPEEITERIFERFFREDTSRTGTVEGSGLGLSIVAAIVKLHGGWIEVDSEKGVGSNFKVLLRKN